MSTSSAETPEEMGRIVMKKYFLKLPTTAYPGNYDVSTIADSTIDYFLEIFRNFPKIEEHTRMV